MPPVQSSLVPSALPSSVEDAIRLLAVPSGTLANPVKEAMGRLAVVGQQIMDGRGSVVIERAGGMPVLMAYSSDDTPPCRPTRSTVLDSASGW